MTDIEKVELKVDEGKILYHYTFIPQVQHLKQELAELMEAVTAFKQIAEKLEKATKGLK